MFDFFSLTFVDSLQTTFNNRLLATKFEVLLRQVSLGLRNQYANERGAGAATHCDLLLLLLLRPLTENSSIISR
jgi:hypothetical protein